MNDRVELEPCPKCKGSVEWTNARDLNILEYWIGCENCQLFFFGVETIAFDDLPNLDYETTAMKYNAWCKTKPTRYREETWVNE